MMHELCRDDLDKWTEALKVGEQSLMYRIKLWDSIKNSIEEKKKNKIRIQVPESVSQAHII